MLPLMAILEWAARRVVASRQEPTGWLSFWGWVSAFGVIPVTQVIYAGAMVSAMLLRHVDWRGVEYQIDGPWGIRLVEYRPYVPPHSAGGSHVASL